MKTKIIFICIITLISFMTISYSHSGKTDSNGGHYDYSTGEYHYHHGYSAHQHINGICPYEVDNPLSLLPSTCPNCNTIINPENGTYCFECGYKLVSLTDFLIPVDGKADMTRSEYFKEIQTLKKQIEKLKNDISEKKQIIDNLIEESEEQKNKNSNDDEKYMFSLLFVSILVALITYNIGKFKNNKY